MRGNKPNINPSQRAANLTMAALAAQGGCFTLAIVVGSLLVGLWLDAQFGQRGPFTIGLLLLSVPISLFVMLRIALGAIKRITPPRKEDLPQRAPEQEEQR
jgi:MFS family permease